MIKAKIKYTGKKSGMLARFYSDFQLFGKFENDEELREAYLKWVKLSKETDWELQLE